MNGFRRHINWTYFFGMIAGHALYLCAIVSQEVTIELYGMGFTENAFIWFTLILYIIAFMVFWGIAIWALKRKGRSLWWILFGSLGILPIVILLLGNKRP